MALKFYDIFPGRARRRVKPDDQGFIEQVCADRVAKFANRCSPRFRQIARNQPSSVMRPRPADADDSNRCWRAAARMRKDRFTFHLRALSAPALK